jgi:hypothetical protein
MQCHSSSPDDPLALVGEQIGLHGLELRVDHGGRQSRIRGVRCGKSLFKGG